jgi:hypothetical protein
MKRAFHGCPMLQVEVTEEQEEDREEEEEEEEDEYLW